jgi:hypothetical protein
LPALGLGGLDQLGQRLAPFGDLQGPRGQALDLGLDLAPAGPELRQVAARLLRAPGPGLPLLGDGSQAPGPGFGLAHQPLHRASSLGQGAVVFGQAGAQLAQLGAGTAQLGHALAGRLGLGQGRLALRQLGRHLLTGLEGRGQPGLGGHGPLGQPRLALPGVIEGGKGVIEPAAQLAHPLRGPFRAVLGGIMLGAQSLQGPGRLVQPRAQVPEPVALGQALGRAGGRVGRGGVAVPAPQGAVPGDQTLAGPQLVLGPASGLRIGDHADLAEPAGQHLGPAHEAGQGRGPLRQGRRRLVGRQGLPVDRRGAVGRGGQVVAQGRAQGRLVAGLDRDGVYQGRPQLAVASLQQGGKRGDLGLQLAMARLGRLQAVPGGGGLSPGLGLLGVRCLDLGADPLQVRLRALHRLLGRPDGGLAHPLRRLPVPERRQLGGPVGEPLQPFGELGDPPLQGRAAGFVSGDRLGQLGHRRFILSHGGFRLGAGPIGTLQDSGLALGRRLQVTPFLVKALPGVGRVLGLGLSAGAIAVGLRQTLLGLGARGGDLGLFPVQIVPIHQQALDGSGSGRLGLAQIRQLGHGRGLLRGASGGRGGERHHRGLRGRQALAGQASRLFRGGAFQMQHHGLVAANMIGQPAVAVGLARLFLQALKLGLQGRDHVVQPFQVGLGGAQAQLRLVAPGVQTGDPGSLFQETPAVAGLGIDHRADPALAHQGRRMGPAGGVGEQQLDVPGAHLAAVDPVGGAAVPLDPAAHLQLVVAVEGRRRGAAAVVQPQRHLGDVARRPAGAAGEDDVVHPAAAHALGRVLAHDPAQGLDQVGLAAAVRPHDPGDPGIDRELGRVHEGLETAQPQLSELHHRSSRRRSPSPRESSLGLDILQNLIEFLVGPRTLHLAPVDDEGRGGVDLVGTLDFPLARQDTIYLVLVVNAGIEGRLVHAGQAGDSRQRADRVLGTRPLLLTLEQGVEEDEVQISLQAIGDQSGPQAQVIQGEMAVDQARPAGLDPFLLDLRQGVLVKIGAVRAGQGGVLDDRDRRVGRAENSVVIVDRRLLGARHRDQAQPRRRGQERPRGEPH